MFLRTEAKSRSRKRGKFMFVLTQDRTHVINTSNILDMYVSRGKLQATMHTGTEDCIYTIKDVQDGFEEVELRKFLLLLRDGGEQVYIIPETEEIPDK